MPEVGSLLVSLRADISQFQNQMKASEYRVKQLEREVKRNTTSMSNGFEKMGGVAKGLTGVLAGLGAALSVNAIANAAKEWMNLYEAQSQAEAGFKQALVSMGRYSATFEQTIKDTATAIQQMSNFGDEAVIEGAKILSTFRQISDEAMPDVLKTTADLAAFMKSDFTAAANIMGKAALGITGRMSQYGISLSEAAKKSGDFNLILAEIAQQVGGQAKAMREASSGTEALNNTLGDTKENLGLLVTEGLRPSIDALDDFFTEFNKNDWQQMASDMRDVGEGIATVGGAMKDIALFAYDYAPHIRVLREYLGLWDQIIDKVKEVTGLNRSEGGDEITKVMPSLQKFLEGLKGGAGGALTEIEKLNKKYNALVKDLERKIALSGLTESEAAALELEHAVEDINETFGALGEDAVFQLVRLTVGLHDTEMAALKVKEGVAAIAKALREEEEMWSDFTENFQDMEEVERAWGDIENGIYDTNTATLEWEESLERVARNVQSNLADVFYDVLSGAETSFEGILDSFRRMLANMIAEAINQRIFIPIFTQVFGPDGKPQGGGGQQGYNVGSFFPGGTAGNYLGYGATGASIGYGATGDWLGTGFGALGGFGGGALAGMAVPSILTAMSTSSFLFGSSTGVLSGLSGASITALGSAVGTIVPIIGTIIGALIGAAVASLFSGGSPEFRMESYADIPTNFQDFLAADPSSLFYAGDIGVSPGSVSSEQRAEIENLLSTIASTTQDWLGGIYEMMPDVIKDAWDAVEWEGFEGELARHEGEDLERLITKNLHDWFGLLNDTVITSLVGATAQGFGDWAGFDQGDINNLSEKWQTVFQDVFDSLFEGLSDPDAILAASNEYQAFVTSFMTGVAGIMAYGELSPLEEVNKMFDSTPATAFAESLGYVDTQIEFITKSLNDLEGQQYANALLEINGLLEERYKMEIQYLTTLRGMQEAALAGIESDREWFFKQTMTTEEWFDYAGEQKDEAWGNYWSTNDPFLKENYFNEWRYWNRNQAQTGVELWGSDWLKDNGGAFLGNLDTIGTDFDRFLEKEAEGVEQSHDVTAEKINKSLIPAIEDVADEKLPAFGGALDTATDEVIRFRNALAVTRGELAGEDTPYSAGGGDYVGGSL